MVNVLGGPVGASMPERYTGALAAFWWRYRGPDNGPDQSFATSHSYCCYYLSSLRTWLAIKLTAEAHAGGAHAKHVA